MPRFSWLPLLFIMLFVAGCGRVSQIHFVKGDFTLHHQAGINLDLVHVDAYAMSEVLGKTLVVQVIDPRQSIQPPSKIIKGVDWPVWWLDYEQFLADRLWQTAVFSDVSAASDVTCIREPDLVLKVAVTQWDEGNGWLRYLIGFGAGATRMQWEGALIDARTNHILLAFADRRLHPGGPSMLWFGWRRALNGPGLIAEDLRYAAIDLCAAIRRLTGVQTEPFKTWKSRPLYRTQAPDPAAATEPDAGGGDGTP